MKDFRASPAQAHPPEAALLEWATHSVCPDGTLVSVTPLHGKVGPWLLAFDCARVRKEVVLRSLVPDRIGEDGVRTNAIALATAERNGLPAPRLLAWRSGEPGNGPVASIETAMPGVSTLQPAMSAAQLRSAGALLARVHGIRCDPQPNLAIRTRPIQPDDFGRDRRWAIAWREAQGQDRQAVIDAFDALFRSPWVEGRRTLPATRTSPLLNEADECVRIYGSPSGPTVLLHGDVWPGNIRFEGDTCTALIDWKTAGVGQPGVDLGSLRLHAALQYGMNAPSHVLTGWEEQAGCAAADVAYWDAVAALNTHAEMEEWTGLDKEGNRARPSLGRERRDAFLRMAVDDLCEQ